MSRLKFRRKENKFTQVYNNIIFKNKNVELTGLYTTIQACIDLEINTQSTEKEFILSKKTLQSFTGYKDDKFKRIWNELKVAGYLKQYKIRDKKTGKFVYEYELLEEPDITTHHSLTINDDGSIAPNISKSKIEKIQKNIENEVQDKVIELPGVENTSLVPEVDFPQSGEMGVYYNNLLNKVCMYVEKTEKYFELREKDIELINQYKSNLSIELFEELLLETVNKDKSFKYFVSALKNTIANNIKTLKEYETHKRNYISSRNKKIKNNKSTNKKEMVSISSKNNKFNNFEQTFLNYEEEEFENIIEKSQRAKYGDR